MQTPDKFKVVIAGGGTAGWMTACALSVQLGHFVDVVLVESEEIGTVGVGEASIPTMQTFHLLCQINESEFLKRTHGTFKLGIRFENWGNVGENYFHSFGETGNETWAGQFQHFWLRAQREGINYPFGDFSVEHQAARAGKFAITRNPRVNYAYHLDASLYAKYLRGISENNGVKRIEGKISRVELEAQQGNIKALILENGLKIDGDFFIDCTGFRALLIGEALHTAYEDWSSHFLCDRAVAVQTQLNEAPVPYTRSIAHSYGWQWQIPLQSRVGNGFVYCSQYISDDAATDLLLKNISGKTINQPRIIHFRPGRRLKSWNKNCVAIGLSSGFIEPLESTSIHLISSSIIRMMRLIPWKGFSSAAIEEEYNRQSLNELNDIKDFIALHYKVTQRADSEFWRYCKNMDVPLSLKHRLELFAATGRIFWSAEELFTVNSWNQVMMGQGIMPQSYHPLADAMSSDEFHSYINGYRNTVVNMVDKMPSHADFIKQHCLAENS